MYDHRIFKKSNFIHTNKQDRLKLVMKNYITSTMKYSWCLSILFFLAPTASLGQQMFAITATRHSHAC